VGSVFVEMSGGAAVSFEIEIWRGGH
jgi:hypothetical protein